MSDTEITMTWAAWRLVRQACDSESRNMARSAEWLGASLRQDYLHAVRVAQSAMDAGSGRTDEMITRPVPDNVLFILEEDHLLKAGQSIVDRA